MLFEHHVGDEGCVLPSHHVGFVQPGFADEMLMLLLVRPGGAEEMLTLLLLRERAEAGRFDVSKADERPSKLEKADEPPLRPENGWLENGWRLRNAEPRREERNTVGLLKPTPSTLILFDAAPVRLINGSPARVPEDGAPGLPPIGGIVSCRPTRPILETRNVRRCSQLQFNNGEQRSRTYACLIARARRAVPDSLVPGRRENLPTTSQLLAVNLPRAPSVAVGARRDADADDDDAAAHLPAAQEVQAPSTQNPRQ